MKIIQTLYIDDSKDPFSYGFGWVKPEYHLMSWALSCLQLKSLYGEVELFANTNAANLLIEILELPYSKVNLTHNNLRLANERLWALPKILTYSLQESPFLHIDGDVFLFDRFSESLLRNELIVQNVEEATDYYISTQEELMANLVYFPKCVKEDFNSQFPIRAVNAGILGGSNIPFIKEYTNVAFEYVTRNTNQLQYINVDKFNVFFEQHLFYTLAKEKNISFAAYFDESINDNGYEHLGDFHETPYSKKYLHLLGDYKRDTYTCNLMAAKLRELYPNFYYKIISICQSKAMITNSNFYYSIKIDCKNDIELLHEKSKLCYQKGIEEFKYNTENTIPSVCQDTNLGLHLLKNIFTLNKETCTDPICKKNFISDFDIFYANLTKTLERNLQIPNYYLYGRDLESQNWYAEIFKNELELPYKIISKCEGLEIIESEFDWAGLNNKFARVGVRYYSNLQIDQGIFYNLVVPEVSENRYSLIDIDELEKLILDHLSVPKSINNLLVEMQCYAEEDVILNNLEAYNNLIIQLIKQLVKIKVIQPVPNIIN